MTDSQWKFFRAFREAFREACARWQEASEPWLADLQRRAAGEGGTPPYPVETPVVYNTALDAFGAEDEIRLVIVSDNPGKDEQLAKNRKYLVGQAGKLGANFFAAHPELGVDYRKNAVILNKTPVHSARTKQLAFLLRHGGEPFRTLFEESQRWMAQRVAGLQQAFACPVWLVGYGELRAKGLFSVFADTLKEACSAAEGKRARELAGRVYLFQHFSMNRFSIDLRDAPCLKNAGGLPLAERLALLGETHRREILGW